MKKRFFEMYIAVGMLSSLFILAFWRVFQIFIVWVTAFFPHSLQHVNELVLPSFIGYTMSTIMMTFAYFGMCYLLQNKERLEKNYYTWMISFLVIGLFAGYTYTLIFYPLVHIFMGWIAKKNMIIKTITFLIPYTLLTVLVCTIAFV